jgi:antitoxin component YwqK of YwqJK toxin-antitoxin module
MYRYILFLICFLNLGLMYAQDNINQVDAEGNRHGVWKKYYNNDRVRYAGKFEHGKEVGVFKYFSASNSDYPIIVKEYQENSDLAKVSFFTPSGALESKGLMKGKEREGEWLYYHADGKSIMSEENYVDGKLDGDYKTYYQSWLTDNSASRKGSFLIDRSKRFDLVRAYAISYVFSINRQNMQPHSEIDLGNLPMALRSLLSIVVYTPNAGRGNRRSTI